ncbi:MAG TPA: PQQ-binding-like beta-propeller repeat protein [Candidatus Hydrogenedentes bacterium]|nr:PQQ-binding-like beta-propeller repeat protein [Candidatus Hydrogenedentota bacterium]HPG66868.1 PQQ-binding-like beta-propeller repeat protein [Candidatus Hydrogenedentota bacterium]
MRMTVVVAAALCLTVSAIAQSDWPQFRADATRGGYTATTLPAKPSLLWRYVSRHAPTPAWVHTDRMPYDHAYHVVVADGTLYFGSSADGKVYALDANTGKERWHFFCDAPVRFAPAVWRDRLFAASDDGFLYCLAAGNGRLLWRKQGGPETDMVLGNDRIVSRRPARGGPVVLDDTVYFGAGIWPSEQIFLYALDAQTGETLWINDDCGGIEMDQPHPTARAKSGVIPQGYLVATGDALVVPTGRSVPAVLSRQDGRLLFYHLQQYGRGIGGSEAMAIDKCFLNSARLFGLDTGQEIAGLSTNATAVTPYHILYSNGNCFRAINRSAFIVDKETTDRKGQPVTVKTVNKPEWELELDVKDGVALIAAGNRAVLGTADGQVLMIDLESHEVCWKTRLEGRPLGLAAADDRLYVSTDRGAIHCFGKKGFFSRTKMVRPPEGHDHSVEQRYVDAAKAIVVATGITDGYCVDIACGDGQLAQALAAETNLLIYAVDPDAGKVSAARERLDAAGLYGTRVTVHQGDPAALPYPPYFANLIVSAQSLQDGASAVPAATVARLQRPFGGVSCLGPPDAMAVDTRGPLEHAGIWTHQYCTPANVNCSADVVVKGPLGMHWFRDSDFFMPSRHGRGPAPLFLDGRLFVEGLDGFRAVDAYNGRPLWEYSASGIMGTHDQEHLVGTSATGSNFCVAGDTLYINLKDRCVKLDVATGQVRGEIPTLNQADGSPGTWGFVAIENGTLYGSLANTEHLTWWAYQKSDMAGMFPESTEVFAMDANTGAVKWRYRAEQSIRNNSIAIGGGRLFLIDRPLALRDRVEKGQDPHPLGKLVALDATTGNVVWQETGDIYGTLLALSVEHDALLMSYQATRFRLNSEVGGRMAVFRASTGQRLWDVKAEYASRPVIQDRTIYMQPGAWDLLTGEAKRMRDVASGAEVPWQFTRSYGCGTIAGSPNLLVFRSATLGYIDLLGDPETHNYGGVRPGCWINAIPAGGLLLMPDATNRCTCSYPIKASVALQAM